MSSGPLTLFSPTLPATHTLRVGKCQLCLDEYSQTVYQGPLLGSISLPKSTKRLWTSDHSMSTSRCMPLHSDVFGVPPTNSKDTVDFGDGTEKLSNTAKQQATSNCIPRVTRANRLIVSTLLNRMSERMSE